MVREMARARARARTTDRVSLLPREFPSLDSGLATARRCCGSRTPVACNGGLKRALNPLDEIVLAYGNVLPSCMHDAPSICSQLVQSISIVGPGLESLMITVPIGLDDQSLFWVREINPGNELVMGGNHELSLGPG